jgi:hypothetical protein
MTIYAIHSMVLTRDGAFAGSRAVPIFYLDSDAQGIVSATHAVAIARGVLNPLGLIPDADLQASAYAVVCPGEPAGRSAEQYTHLVKRASGVTAGWHHSQGDAQFSADECNRLNPTDPATVALMEGDEAWDGILGNPSAP